MEINAVNVAELKIHKTKKILSVKERLQVYYFLQNKIKVIYSLFTLALYPQLKY